MALLQLDPSLGDGAMVFDGDFVALALLNQMLDKDPDAHSLLRPRPEA